MPVSVQDFAEHFGRSLGFALKQKAVVICILVLAGCSRSNDSAANWTNIKVELSPGVFVPVAEKYENNDRPISFEKLHSPGGAPPGKLWEETELRIPWLGREVKWKGAGRPITLRAKDNQLYLISFDRTTRGIEAADFSYFARSKDGFKEITRSDFPRSIACQNMSFWYRHENCDGVPRDQVQIARDTNPADVCFRSSLTAYLWGQLATDMSYAELQRQWLVPEELLQDYLRTNEFQRLTVIIKE